MKLLKKLFNRLKILKKWQKILLIAILALVIYFLFFRSSKDSALTLQFTEVKKGNLQEIVSETGEVSTSNKTEIASSISGVVTEIYIENGQTVKKGDKLFYVESSATEEDRSKAYSEYLSAKNNLASAKAKMNTLDSAMWKAHEEFESKSLDTDLSVDDPIYIQTKGDWQAAEANRLNQDQVIAQAQSALNNAALAYQATSSGPVKATVDGQIANLSIAVGQTVASTDSALIIKTTSENWVVVAINENDIVEVAPEQKAIVLIDALSEIELPATVQRVDEFATISSDVAVYYVYLTLDESNQQLRPGMTAQVSITTQEKNDILLIPNSAIKPYQGEKAVQIFDEETQSTVYQPVKIGLSGDVSSEVLSGLSEGQKIISSDSSSSKSSSGGGGFMMGGN
ncbi:efflux RND transporter periplasmic adaptor subunit [Patescibacteria group bacterium]|nr:efflux RND transporter periplasmic adaptor subunit [Patescibacteria group bacterium]